MTGARARLRRAVQRALGVPDAAELSAALGRLHESTVAVQSSIEALTVGRATDTAERQRIEAELATLQRVIVDQTLAIERLQGQRTAGPGR